MATTITQEDIDALERMIIRGVLETEYQSGGEKRRVKYRTMGELERALSYAKRALAESSGASSGMTTLARCERD